MDVFGHAQITRLLQQWRYGDLDAFQQVIDLVHQRLRAIAHQRLSRDAASSDMQTTELLHEAWLSLVQKQEMPFQSRLHFFHTAGLAMHRFLVDEARKRSRLCHGGHLTRTELDEHHGSFNMQPEKILAIDTALSRLEQEDPELVTIVKLRYFADFTIKETAEILGVPTITVNRQWAFARALLHKLLKA